jgi:glutamine amidotransferase
VIALVDYGAGNLASVRRALSAAGGDVRLVSQADRIAGADAVVVPGVGHFQATSVLGEDWHEALRLHLRDGRPLLGICLGMQWLYERSAEAPAVPGLGLFAGTCRRIEGEVKVPHVGWNAIARTSRSELLEGIADGTQFYFTHSYAAPVTPDCAATTTHGSTFAAVVERGPIFGVQFHPEKSGDAGLQVLRRFVSKVR